MKLNKVFSLVLLLSLMVFISSSVTGTPVSMAAQPSDIGAWQTGPFPPDNFQYARHDGAFVPGPALEPWANKVYFPGGRTSPPTESPNIWMFDPLTGTYTDTGADVVEDVSNYNANLVKDDGTGRGPAVYVIGGTNKDGGGVSIGTVQRYYPQTNEAEALPSADNWNGSVGGSRVAAMGTVVVDDIIYVYGGWETDVAPYFSNETWAFDPNQPSGSRWTNLGTPLSTPRSYIMSAVQDGKVYAIGGVGIYAGGELDPVNTFEVLDTANLAAGWTELAPMPIAGGEGRGFGFDSDTLKINSPYKGMIYVVAPNDWPDVSGEVYEYDVETNTWRSDLPELPTPRADLAGSFVPLCTSDPNDGLPGLWTFGGRVNESCEPPLGPAEYAPMVCESVCIPLTNVDIHGPGQLEMGQAGTYTATILPDDASAPLSLLWDNGETAPETTYNWDVPGIYTVVITATNCEDSAVVTDTLDVIVTGTDLAVTMTDMVDPIMAGEEIDYLITITNYGPDESSGSMITDTLPASFIFVSANPGCDEELNVVNCQVGSLPVNETAIFTITTVAPEPGIYTNTAEVTGIEADPDPVNNQTEAQTTVESYMVNLVYHDLEDVVHEGESIYARGDWNGWSFTADPLTPNLNYSVFTATLELGVRDYGYRYVVYTDTLPTGEAHEYWLQWYEDGSPRMMGISGDTIIEDYRDIVPGSWELWFPDAITVTSGTTTEDILGWMWAGEFTFEDMEPRSLLAEMGFGTGLDPAAWTTWEAMLYNGHGLEPNNAEHVGNFTPIDSGVFSYAVRYNPNWGEGNPNNIWYYGDTFWDGEYDPEDAGVLTVVEVNMNYTYLPVSFK